MSITYKACTSCGFRSEPENFITSDTTHVTRCPECGSQDCIELTTYVATVHVLIDANDVEDASDTLERILDSAAEVRDWSYLKVGQQPLLPVVWTGAEKRLS